MSTTRWPLVCFGLGLAYLAAFQLFKLPPVLPTLLDLYGYDRTLAGGLVSVYAVVGLLLSIPLGRWLEKLGPWPPLGAALLIVLLANLLALLEPGSIQLLLLARGLEGISFTVLAITGPAFANRYAGPAALPLIIGLTAAWIPTGQLLATVLTPLALSLYGWQALWWLAMLATLAMAAWCWLLARQGVSLAASHGGPAPVLSVLQRRRLYLVGGIFLLWSGQFFAYMTWLPQYLVEVHGFSLKQALLGYALPVVMVIIGNLAGGWLLRCGWRVGPLLGTALGIQVLVWALLPITGGGWGGICSLLAYGVGAGISPTCLFAMPSTIVGQRGAAARAFAIIMTGRNGGVLLGPVLLAEALKWAGEWRIAGPLFGAITALGMIMALMLSRQLRTDDQRNDLG